MLSQTSTRHLVIDGRTYDLDHAIDISLPITPDDSLNAFSLPRARFEPFRVGAFVGSIEEGGPVRCDVVTLAPHGNGTHTECVGHIAGRGYTVDECMRDLVDSATLVSVELALSGGDLVVSRTALERAWQHASTTTLILRTLPNDPSKRTRQWSANNPPYIHIDAMDLIVERGIRHLMVDLPSVDREEDAGALVAHHRFWQWPHDPRPDCTITELIFVPDAVPDGIYGVMFNVAPFHGDAAPSRPVLVGTLRV
ncbi:MAG: cyclase family protein [Candidatus Kapabacteria bacterium]|nr:cyclase family protein [Candidatus Kapabacteria bacterium]